VVETIAKLKKGVTPVESGGPEVLEKTGFEASVGMTISDFYNWLGCLGLFH
jgi:hypothetical protein